MNEATIRNIGQEALAPQRQERRPNTIGRIAFWVSLVLASTIFLFAVGLLSLSLVGFRYISGRGESMEPTLSGGSLLIAKRTAPEDLRVGDIIAFPGPSGMASTIVHRVIYLQEEGQHIAAITKGDNNSLPDRELLRLEGPVERVVLTVPYLGWLFTPAFGWQLLGFGVLLGLWTTLHWRVQRKAKGLPSA